MYLGVTIVEVNGNIFSLIRLKVPSVKSPHITVNMSETVSWKCLQQDFTLFRITYKVKTRVLTFTTFPLREGLMQPGHVSIINRAGVNYVNYDILAHISLTRDNHN